MERQTDSALVGRIIQIAFSAAFIGVCLYAIRGMMFGSSFFAKLLILGIVGTAIVFALDKRYWILSAFLFGYNETIPVVRFTGAELGAIVLVATYFVRQALHRDVKADGSKLYVLAALPFMAWMCLVWSLNPVGMFIFGSTSIGGRFYLKVILAFLSLFVLSNLRFDERDCKVLCISLACGYVAFVLRGLVWSDVDEAVLGSSVHYVFLNLSFVAPMFLCRFSAPELLSRIGPLLLFLITFGLSFYSGNRTAAARPVLVGLMAPFFLKKDMLKTWALVIFSGVALSILVIGQGVVWNLPFAIQRPLSFLPGRWDWRLESYGFNDDFRATLRMYAREHIQERPWFGDGGFSLDFSDMAWVSSNRNRDQDGIKLHVLSRNWHNVWYGMAADFGIPLSMFWGVFMLVLIVGGFRGCKRLPPGSWWQTAYLYFYLMVLTEFVNFFFNGGHTARTAQQLFLWAGLLSAVLNGVPRNDRFLRTEVS